MSTSKLDAQGRVVSVEAADGAWWVMAVGGKKSQHVDEADALSISGHVRVDRTPYQRRYVGHGAIMDVLAIIGHAPIGTDEATDQPILSAATVQALASA